MKRYEGEPFDTYYMVEALRQEFESYLDIPRDFLGDEDAEEAFYRQAVEAYLIRLDGLVH